MGAIFGGGLAILPTDTVYGLCSLPDHPDAIARLSKLKRRDHRQPIALVAADVATLLKHLPEAPTDIVSALLPGAYTLVLRNPARRFPALSGAAEGTIGVRVPQLSGVAKEVFDVVGAVAATSANLHGGRDPRTVHEIPRELRDAVSAILDVGELPGRASTVVDFTGPEPRILRVGAGDVDRALGAIGGPRE